MAIVFQINCLTIQQMSLKGPTPPLWRATCETRPSRVEAVHLDMFVTRQLLQCWGSIIQQVLPHYIQLQAGFLFAAWWFGTCFIFPYIWNNHPKWLSFIFFRWFQTTSQLCGFRNYAYRYHYVPLKPPYIGDFSANHGWWTGGIYGNLVWGFNHTLDFISRTKNRRMQK